MPKLANAKLPHTKSPIKTPPLPQAGDSSYDWVQEIIQTKLYFWALIGAVFLILACTEWLGWYWDSPRQPYFYTFIALIAIVISVFQVRKHFKQIKQISLGARGERAIGQYLDDELKPLGYYVFHDIVENDNGATFNIDHVVIGPAGVFAIETKTRSKREAGQNRIEFDGRSVRLNGGPPDEAPIRQVNANAKLIREVLEDSTGRKGIKVQSVVLYSGWWIEGNASGAPVWVLEPKALPKWLANAGNVLSTEDVALYRSRLAVHVRGK